MDQLQQLLVSLLNQVILIYILIYVIGLALAAFFGIFRFDVPATLSRYHGWFFGKSWAIARSIAGSPFIWVGQKIKGSPPTKKRRRR